LPKLDKAVKVLNDHPDIKIEIGGHTDSTGSREYNLDLSRRRARSVKEYFLKKGIDDKRLTTRGYGPDKPVDDNETPEGRSHNRRIEFVIAK
jgi:outer membrane protein OmpA-like peptidoglycan-associated protein